MQASGLLKHLAVEVVQSTSDCLINSRINENNIPVYRREQSHYQHTSV
jgi:hypothetical protein